MTNWGQFLNSDQKFSRWNVDPTWHHFCSMYQEATCASEANHEFAKYHHLRGCFYFAIGAVESFLNQQMRKKLKNTNTSEVEILKIIRQGKLKEKIKDWPKELFLREHEIPKDITEELFAATILRDEITHPKHTDHAIYKELDNANDKYITQLVSTYIASVYEGMEAPFPYWITGWNFIGLNGDMSHPFLSNNLNGFVPALRYMGYKVPSGIYGEMLQWEKSMMGSLEGYKQLKAGLDQYPETISPFIEQFPLMPRLTKRWWKS